MTASYNGWSAAPGWSVTGGQLANLVVAGEAFAPGVRAGDVFTVFQYLANNLHARVEPIIAVGWHTADDWGYSYRQNRNANNLSCHASGTAIDYNATRHPNGRTGTFTAAQVTGIRHILAELGGVVRWGGDFTGTKDEMHFEIVGTPSQVAAVAARLRGIKPPPGLVYESRVNAKPGARVVKLGSVGDDVAYVQRWHGLADDGFFGPATEAKVKATQARNRVTADGIVGPVTWRLLGV